MALMRPKHWVKNALVLFPVVFGGALTDPAALASSALGLAAFCLVASGIYVVNDLNDVERDRANPRKAHRPIASGAVSEGLARVVAVVLFAGAAALNVAAAAAGAGDQLTSLSCLMVYVVLNLLYSTGLKSVPIVDIAILAAGYFLRVLYGSCLTGIEISAWLYLTIISLSFYLGLGKRRGEREAAQATGGEVREVVSKYPEDFLSTNMTVFFTLGLVFYSLWATDAAISAHTGGRMAWTIPLVFLICLRYSFLLGREQHGDPVDVVFSDRALLGLLAAFCVAVVAIVYLGSGAVVLP